MKAGHFAAALRAALPASDVLTLAGVYHDFDYGLFYMNIRENVSMRVEAARHAP